MDGGNEMNEGERDAGHCAVCSWFTAPLAPQELLLRARPRPRPLASEAGSPGGRVSL